MTRRRVLLLALALAVIVWVALDGYLRLARADSFTFTVPAISADRATCQPIPWMPAGIAKVRIWLLDARRDSPVFNRWLPYKGIGTFECVPGSIDGKRLRFIFYPTDTFGVRVAIGDSSLNWSCRDAVVWGRR